MDTKSLALLNERKTKLYYTQLVEKLGPLLCNGQIAVVPIYSRKLLHLSCSSIFPNMLWGEVVRGKAVMCGPALIFSDPPRSFNRHIDGA